MPPLTRFIAVRRLSGKDALNGLIATSSVTKEVADLLQFMPLKAAASLLLLVLETIQDVQTQQEDCYRLARRCVSLLVDIRDQLVEHEDTAPPSLLKALSKLEATLDDIHKFVKQVSEQKWSSRLMRKGSIESALAEYNSALDDAVRAFHTATLINIHLAVGDRTLALARRAATLPPYPSESIEMRIIDTQEVVTSPSPQSTTESRFPPIVEDPLIPDSPLPSDNSVVLVDLASPATTEFQLASTEPLTAATDLAGISFEEEEMARMEHHGFSRYHQSQFRFKGKSRTIKDGWWAGATEGEITGEKSLMLRYEGHRYTAVKRWLRDVKILQNVHHPNLPQMVGYSNDETPTPFILLANVQTRLPQALLLDALKNANLARCAQVLLQFYRDTLDAALYLQRQMNLSDSKVQDYVEHANFRIDAQQTVIMGLPPPEVDDIVSWRNFGLAHSIRDIYLKLLPNRGLPPREPVSSEKNQELTASMQLKVNHLTILARALLPSSDDITVVQGRLHKLLGSCEDEEDEEFTFDDGPPKTLREIRKAAIAANTHQQAWFENTGIAPHQFSVGDLGYLPKTNVEGEKDWANFVVLCNVFDEGLTSLETQTAAEGKQGGWQGGVHNWEDLPTYELPGDIHGWTVVVPPEAEYTILVTHTNEVARVHDAWNFLLDAGKSVAARHGVKPEDLILITRTGAEQRFRVRDLRRIQYWPASSSNAHGGHHAHFQRGFHGGHHSPFGHAGHHHHGFGGQGGGDARRVIAGQDLAPKVFYLFTSPHKAHEPYFAQTPLHKPLPEGEKPPEIDANTVRCFAYLDLAYGFVNYVQLHAEDFAD